MPATWNVSWHHISLGIPPIWTQGFTGQGVTVALLDTGLAAPKGLDRTDFEYLDARGGRILSADPLGHGTAAGSTIASYVGGVLGIAPHAKLVSVQVLGTANSIANVESAFGYLLQRDDIDVVSCSFVMTHATEAVRDAVRRLTNSGKIVIAAAGDDELPMQFPEQTANALTVAAVDPAGHPLQGARTGSWIDVAAPGLDIPVVLPGTARVGRFGQSSAAAAVTSGVAALVLSTCSAGPKRLAIARRLEELFKTKAVLGAEDPNAVGRGLINPAALVQAAQTINL